MKIYKTSVTPNFNKVTKENTGFIEGCVVTGTANRTVVLSGTVTAYWQGKLIPTLISGWESTAHGTDTTKIYYLYSSTGADPTWSETAWKFSYLQVAFAFYDATLGWVYQRETHSFMPVDCHENDHYNIGSWRESGGDISNVVTGSTIAANRRPFVSSVVHHDEDLETVQAEITTNSYTIANLTSTGIVTFTENATDIVPLLTANPYYNSYSAPNWGQTLMPANSVMSVWLVSLPMAADTNSQHLRFFWEQGQWITLAQGPAAGQLATALSTELLRTYGEMNQGNLASLSPEALPLARLTITYTASNWYISSVQQLVGSSFQLSQSSSGNFLSTVTTDATLTGSGTVASPLSAIGGSGLTAGSIPFSDGTKFIQDNANLFWDDTNNRLGIGTITPISSVEIVSLSQAGQTLTTYGSSGSFITGKFANGSLIAPTAVIKDDVLFAFGCKGYGTSQFSTSNTATWEVRAAATFTNTSNPTYHRWDCTAVNSITRGEKMRLDSTGFLGINTSAPKARLHVSDGLDISTALYVGTEIFMGNLTGSSPNFRLASSYAGNANPPSFVFIKSRGTLASPTGVLINDQLGCFVAQGYTGAARAVAAQIYFEADANAASGSMAGRIRFDTTPTGSTTPLERMRITSTGNIGIGTTDPKSLLHVAGGVQIGNDTAVASADKVGTLRYYVSGNNSYIDICMQTGASTYAWINIITYGW